MKYVVLYWETNHFSPLLLNAELRKNAEKYLCADVSRSSGDCLSVRCLCAEFDNTTPDIMTLSVTAREHLTEKNAVNLDPILPINVSLVKDNYGELHCHLDLDRTKSKG